MKATTTHRVRKKHIEEDNHLVSATVNCHPFPFNSFMSVCQVKLLIRGGLIKIWCSNFLFFCVKKHFNNSGRVDGKKIRENFSCRIAPARHRSFGRGKKIAEKKVYVFVLFFERCVCPIPKGIFAFLMSQHRVKTKFNFRLKFFGTLLQAAQRKRASLMPATWFQSNVKWPQESTTSIYINLTY